MEATCLNCNTEITQNFCANCGQKKYKRIDRKYIWDEVQYSTVHMNKGFFYSLKNTLKNPGKTARTFIDGNRVNHYKPIALAFILSGITAFVAYKIVGANEALEALNANTYGNSEFMHDFMSFTKTYYAFLMLLMVPFFAAFTRLSFKSWGHNYYEHIIMNAYILCYYNLSCIIILYPLMYFFRDNMTTVISLNFLSMASFLIIIPYFFKNFYAEHSFKRVLKRFLLFLALASIFSVILFILIIIGMIGYISVFNPETLKQFAPKPAA